MPDVSQIFDVNKGIVHAEIKPASGKRMVSNILSITIRMNEVVLNESINLTSDPVVIIFENTTSICNIACCSRSNGAQNWQNNGCDTEKILNLKKTKCTCNHLTDFAILLSNDLLDACNTNDEHILEIVYIVFSVTYVPLAIWSLVSIGILILNYNRLKKKKYCDFFCNTHLWHFLVLAR